MEKDGFKPQKPKKRMRSVWIVLITTFVTTVLAGGGVAGYLYWKDNFANTKEEVKVEPEEKTKEDKIENRNLVVVTSSNKKLFFNFLNLENDKIIKKEMEIDATIRDGEWGELDKNPLIQLSKDGRDFVFGELKESTISDSEEYYKAIKSDIEKREKETVFESSDSLGIGNFIYTGDNIFYLKAEDQDNDNDSDKDIAEEDLKWDIMSYDLKTKNEDLLAEDIGDFFQGKLDYQDGKILSLYKSGSKFYEVSLDKDSKKLEKTYLFSHRKTYDYELEIDRVFPSPLRKQFLYEDYSTKDNYSLKLYDINTKKVSILVKNQESSSGRVFWSSEAEIVFLKNPSTSNTSDELVQYEIIKVNSSSPNVEEGLVSSSDVLLPLVIDSNFIVYSENSKVIYLEGSEKKEFELKELEHSPDILYLGIFDY